MNDIKYKIGFSGTAHVLFALMSKLLPDELEVEVEEIGQQSVPDPVIRFDKRFDAPKLAKPKRKIAPRKSPGPNFEAGINKIILAHLSDGVAHRAEEFRPLLKAAGYSESSVASRIEELRKFGVVRKVANGVWRKVEEPSV